LPVIVGLVQLFGCAAAARSQPDARPLDALAYALLAAGPLALVFRKRRPAVVLLVATAATCGYFPLGYRWGPGFLAAVAALPSAVRAGYRVMSWVAGGVAYLVWALAGRVWPASPLARPGLGHAVLVAAWLLAAYGVAEFARVRSA